MKRRIHLFAHLWLGSCLAVLAFGAKAETPLSRVGVVTLDIKSQPVGAALNALAQQAGIQVLFYSDVSNGLKAPALSGTFTPDEALIQLLSNTDLTYSYVNPRTVAIHRAASTVPAGRTTREQAAPHVMRLANLQISEQPSDEVVQETVRPEVRRQNSSEERRNPRIEEVIVTAQKSSERLQDVPVPVTVISADNLVHSNQLQLQDYYTRIPALNLTTANPYGGAMIALRGVTTGGYTAPTVGIVVDDVPFTSSTTSGGGFVAGDIDPSDLARVEILRGPQGTLYGASSIGGLIKYVTVDPSTDAVSGRIQVGSSSVHNGDQLGYGVRGAVNVPLGDTWAVRASGFTRRDPGYIDDPVHGENGVNWAKVVGGRVSTLWRPSEIVTVKLGALLQDEESHGASYVDVPPGVGELQQSRPPGSGGYDKEMQVYSANLVAKLGRLDLTAVSAYADKDNAFSIDFTRLFGTGTTSIATYTTKKFSQEIRLSTAIGNRVDWLFGVFYTDEDSRIVQDIWRTDFTTGIPTVKTVRINNPTTFTEYAAFTNLTFHITDRFNVQIGGRESDIRQTRISHSGPALGIPTEIVTQPKTRSKENSFTYLLTPQFKVSPDLMLYARLASGYRPGGPNTAAAIALGLPSQFEADQTQNYEIGVKGNLLDRVLSFDASAYYIDWKDIQVTLSDPVTRFGYSANGARARSQGVEFSVESRPLSGLTVTAWAAWNDAALTEDFPPTNTSWGVDGERLPLSARFSANLSLEHDFYLTSRARGFVGASVSYVGDRLGVFKNKASTPERQIFPAYTKTDLNAGARYEFWTMNAFVNNVTDRRALLTGGLGSSPADTLFTVIQPRTIGLSLTRDF